jgi:hypothetical protein
MGWGTLVSKGLPYLDDALRFARPIGTHLGNNLWKYGGAYGFGSSALQGEGLGGMIQGGLQGASMGQIFGLGGPKARFLGRAGLTKMGVPLSRAQNLAAVGVPLASGLGVMATSGSGGPVGGAVNRTGGIAASQLSGRGDPNSGDVLGSQNLPPGTIDRMMGPQGNYWYRLDPAGVPFGDRLGRQLDARTNANVMNILGDTTFAQTERKEKADLARQAAAKQLKENIEMARAMSEASQASGFNMAEASNQAVANAMQNRNNFRYF